MSSSNVSVFLSPLHADGLKATKPLTVNEVIYQETPLYFLQTVPNRQHALVCGNCSKFLGSVGLQIKYLQKVYSREDLSKNKINENDESFPSYKHLSEIVPCQNNCGELYCSEACRDHHVQRSHKLLCTGLIADSEADFNPLYQFKIHALNTNEIFLMAADIYSELCQLCSTLNGASPSNQEIANVFNQRFEGFVRNIWWEAIKPTNLKEKKTFKQTLQTLIKDCSSLLQDVFGLQELGLDSILNEEYLARLIGMFEQNNIGVRVENPILTFIKENRENEELALKLLEETQLVVDNIEECEEVDDFDDENEEEDGGEEEEEEEEEAEEEGEQEGEQEVEETNSLENNSTKLFNLLELHGDENVYPPLDGTAFYSLSCKINHSCDPNVRVTYAIDNLKGLQLQLIALKNISENEELVQSYINQHQTKKERQKALKDYGFVCACHKCSHESI